MVAEVSMINGLEEDSNKGLLMKRLLQQMCECAALGSRGLGLARWKGYIDPLLPFKSQYRLLREPH